MALPSLQLVCTILVLFFTSVVRSQSTTTINGLVAATGQPSTTISYLIAGSEKTETPSSPLSTVTGIDSSLSTTSLPGSQPGDSLPVGAVIGIVITVAVFTAIAITGIVYVHKHHALARGQAKRKSIMDLEFGISSPVVQHHRQRHAHVADLAKPLPVVTVDDDMDRLSRSSTIIVDAAEVAKINRKASIHQSRHKVSRDTVRERDRALRTLLGDGSRGGDTNGQSPTGTVLPELASTDEDGTEQKRKQSTETDPTLLLALPKGGCTDGDGDPFTRRLSKL